MYNNPTCLAFDLGASSGRAVVGDLDLAANRISVIEVHRFPNDPVQVGHHLHWDILRLLHEIKQGILKAKHLRAKVESLGIDSWALDFGLIGETGELLGNPYHYRDGQTLGMLEEVVQKIGRDVIFDITGIQFMPINTIYQLYALKQRNPSLLERAHSFLMIPELLRYFLTGKMMSEYTNATTTQLVNGRKRVWDQALIGRLDIPSRLFHPPVPSGTLAGTLSRSVCNELGVDPIKVVAVAEHDTAAAVAAIPAEEKEFAYLICGTWSLLGTELASPVLSEQALDWNFTNEGGVNGTYRLLKNIMGLWLMQECKRTWEKEGKNFDFPQLIRMAQQAEPLRCLIDPDDIGFLNPAHMPAQIQQFCRATGQRVPRKEGEIIRCVLESLALKYRLVLERTETLSGKRFQVLHAVGGGSQNELLCQFTANAIDREVRAGPVEASAIGNLMVQWIALGHISGLEQGRAIVRDSFPAKCYVPEAKEEWHRAYETFVSLYG